MKSVLSVLLLVMLAGSAQAGLIATPYVAGTFNGWGSPNSYPMSQTGPGSDIWTVSIFGLTPGARYEFKITDGTWALPALDLNSWATADSAGNLTIIYDGNVYDDGFSPITDRIGLSTDTGQWTVTGNFLASLGGSDWDNASPVGAMNHLGGGIYDLTVTLLQGRYEWMPVLSGSWDGISPAGRTAGISPWSFDLSDTTSVSFRVDALSGTACVIGIPEPATFCLLAIASAAFLLRRRHG